MRLEHPISGAIQQGAIFNCVVVPGYDGCACHGIVLNARCDLAHEKHKIINYLPIVRFSHWVQRDMCYQLAKRLLAEFSKAIANVLRNKGVSEKLREIFPLKEIIQKESKGKELTSLLEKCSQLELLNKVVALEGSFNSDWKTIMQIDGRQCDLLVKELVRQKLAEYYFLEGTDIFSGATEGHVILLGHMQTIDSEVMKSIAMGISKDDPPLLGKRSPPLTFAEEPICMITGVLRSPDIEHLAQQFANLYVRVGLEDYAESIIERHSQIAKGSQICHT